MFHDGRSVAMEMSAFRSHVRLEWVDSATERPLSVIEHQALVSPFTIVRHSSVRRVVLLAAEHLTKLSDLFWRHLFTGHLFDEGRGALQCANNHSLGF